MGIFDFFKGNKKEISNKKNQDNFLLENLIFPNINGIDFINAETKSSNIKKSLEDDVDGKWYYSQSPLICLMKSVSPSIFGDELDKLLTANNLKYSNHRIRNNIKYWDFEVENNVKETENKTLKYSIEAYTSKEISMITIINLSMADINSIKLRDTNLTSKKHNEKWVKGLDIFDGEEVINKDNTLFKAQNVPLLFYESDLTYILIPHIPHISIAKQIIDVIIKENGGADSFKKLEEEGWEYLHSCNNFIVGYVTEHSVVRLNKKAAIKEDKVGAKIEAEKDLNYHYKRVIDRTDRLKRLLEIIAPPVILGNEKKYLQEAVDDFLVLSNKESVKTEFPLKIHVIKEMLPEIKEMISKVEVKEAENIEFLKKYPDFSLAELNRYAKDKADEAKEEPAKEKADDTTKETRYWILYNGYIIKGQGDPYDGTLIYELSLKVAQEDPEDMDYESDSYEHYILKGSIYHFGIDEDLQYTLNSSELDPDDDDWGELIYYNIHDGAFSPDSEGVIPTPQTKSGDAYVNFEESGDFYVNWEDCFNKKEALLKIKEIEDKLVKETAKHYEVSKLKEAKKEKQVFEHINSEGKTFYLTYKDVVMGGRSRTIYFFSKDIGPNACDLPSGKCVVENQKTRLPFLKDISANEEELENDIWAVGTYRHYYFLKKAKISVEENNGHDPEMSYNDGMPFRTTNIRIGVIDPEEESFVDFWEIKIDDRSGKVVDHDLNESNFVILQQKFGLEVDDFYKDNIEWEELRESEWFTFKKESEADKEFEKQIKLCQDDRRSKEIEEKPSKEEVKPEEEQKEDGIVTVKCTNCDVSLISHRDLMNLSICIQCKSRNTLYVEGDEKS